MTSDLLRSVAAILGSIVQVPVSPRDEVIAELGGLGRVQLSVEL